MEISFYCNNGMVRFIIAIHLCLVCTVTIAIGVIIGMVIMVRLISGYILSIVQGLQV